MPKPVLLVHGAWHGAWCFERVLPLLEARDVRGHALDLPGHGDDAGTFSDLHGDAAAVRAAIDTIGEPTVVVGHSYGGAVVTEAGVHPLAARLVFLAAFALDTDESCVAAATGDPATDTIPWHEIPSLAHEMRIHDDGTSTLTERGVAECLYNDCDADTVAWASEHVGAHPGLNLSQAPDAIGWRATPSTYVVCERDQAVHPALQRIIAKRCNDVVSWDTSHSPFASQPELVASLLAELAGGVS